MGFKLVIFDLGNVLVWLRPEQMIRQVAARTGKAEAHIKEVLSNPRLLEPFELGQITPQQYFEQANANLGLAWGFDQFVTAWNSILSENAEATWLLPRLRQRYKLLVLSNTDPLHDEHIRKTWPVFSHIHQWILSYQVGFRKPDPQIYRLALRQAEVSPAACVYVDDIQEHVEVASRLGITSIHFVNGLRLEEELRAAGIHV